jgi:hypothetical protein
MDVPFVGVCERLRDEPRPSSTSQQGMVDVILQVPGINPHFVG